MKVKTLFNPIYIITFMYILLLLLLKCNTDNILYSRKSIVYLYFIIPYIMYLVFYIIMSNIIEKKNKKNKIISNKRFINKFTLTFITKSVLLILLIFIINMVFIIKNNDFSQINVIYNMQIKGGVCFTINSLILTVMPLINSIILINKKYISKFEYKMVLFLDLLTIIFAILVSLRVNAIAIIISTILVKYREKNLNLKMIKRIVVILFIIMSVLFFGQYIKSKNKSMNFIAQTINSYYYNSVKNAIHVIENNYSFNRISPGYWTVYRPLEGIPKIKGLFLENFYEKNIGYVPIKSREDDFLFLKNIGIENYWYNTFSVFGYSFLDFGMKGIYIVFINFFICQIIYWKMINSYKWSVSVYPIFYVTLLDMLRTNGIFSFRISIMLCILVLIVFLNKVFSSLTKVDIRILKQFRSNV